MQRIIAGPPMGSSAHETEDQYLRDKIGAINRQRISRVLWIVVLIHLAHVMMFWPYVPGALESAAVWRNGIILIHAAMVVALAVIWPVLMLLKRPSSGKGWEAVTGLIGLLYLMCGTALAIVDQLVTSSITPLLVVNTGVAMILVIRPVIAALNSALVLVVFMWGVSLTQPDPDLLLTIRVNSLSATGLGFGLALLQWRGQVLTIRQQRRIEEQQRELEEKNRELTLLASRDVLTGLLNRAQFLHDAEHEVARMRRSGTSACLVMCDVDHFKLVNDSYGHPVGDLILTEVARILSRMLRSTDMVARFGGEEFAILLPDTTAEAGLNAAEKLWLAIEEHPVVVGAQTLRVTASFGVAELSAGRPDALQECYRAADRALYQAKANGRNCVRLAELRGDRT